MFGGHGGGAGVSGFGRTSDRCGLFGKAKVQNLGLVTVGDKDVGRLDVAMHDALGVRRVERVGNL